MSELKKPCFRFAAFLFSDGLEKRFGSLSASVSERAEQLQTAVAQSVSVQEGLKGLLSWLDKLALNPGPVQPTAQAVQDALTQNQVGTIPELFCRNSKAMKCPHIFHSEFFICFDMKLLSQNIGIEWHCNYDYCFLFERHIKHD